MKDIDVMGLVKLLIGALAPAAVFYGFGYIITRAYVISTGLQASFWFTEGFYREAGARFLLDILVAVALLPHVFMPLSALFLVLLPGEAWARRRGRLADLSGRLGFGRVAGLREAAFALLVALAVSAIVLVLIDCGPASRCATLREAPPWLFTSSWLLAGAADQWLLQQPSLFPMVIFLAVAVPTTLTLGLLACRMLTAGPSTALKPTRPLNNNARPGMLEAAHPAAAFLVAATFIVLVFYIPIAYGAYFYDFVVVRLLNVEKCSVRIGQSAPEAGAPAGQGGSSSPAADDHAAEPVECYLLGHFDTRYILIGRNQSDRERSMYIKQVTQLEPFAIESWGFIPLRDLRAYEPGLQTGASARSNGSPD